MATRVIKDPNNKWMVYVDWSEWLADLAEKTGGTATITSSLWDIPAALVEEDETPEDDINGVCYFVGSGGEAGESYDLVNRITYSLSALSVTDLTEDRTITVLVRHK